MKNSKKLVQSKPPASLAKIELKRRELQRDFGAFYKWAWSIIEPETPIVWSEHYDLMCEWLTYCGNGSFRKENPDKVGVWFCVPPRSGKSDMFTCAFPCWNWTFSPSEKFMCVSYGAELATPFSLKRRRLIQSPQYQSLWPKIQLSEDMNLKTRFDNSAGGYMLAGTNAGSLTGHGATRIIMDDLLKAKDAYSDPFRKASIDLYDETLRSRFNDPVENFYLGVSQRLHPMDIVGWLKEHESDRWVFIDIPMVCE